MMKSAEEFVMFGQGNLEAFMKSSQILATGFQDMAKMATATAQSGMEEAMSAFRAMTQIRSVKDAMELQSTLARASIDKAVSQGGQVAEATYKLAEQAIAPIAHRMTIAAETFTRI